MSWRSGRGAGRGRPRRCSPRAGPAVRGGSGSRLGVGLDLISDDVGLDARVQVVSETVRHTDQHVGDVAVLHQLPQHGLGLAAVILSQEPADHLQGQVALEVQHQIIDQICHELIQSYLPQLCLFACFRRLETPEKQPCSVCGKIDYCRAPCKGSCSLFQAFVILDCIWRLW